MTERKKEYSQEEDTRYVCGLHYSTVLKNKEGTHSKTLSRSDLSIEMGRYNENDKYL